MIFITDKERKTPLMRAYVNKIIERDYQGGTIKTYILGTSEKKQNGEKVYSSWFCGVMGNAKRKEEELKEGVAIDVYSFKMSNVSKKNDDGTYSKAFLSIMISDFDIHQYVDYNNIPVADENTPF